MKTTTIMAWKQELLGINTRLEMISFKVLSIVFYGKIF